LSRVVFSQSTLPIDQTHLFLHKYPVTELRCQNEASENLGDVSRSISSLTKSRIIEVQIPFKSGPQGRTRVRRRKSTLEPSIAYLEPGETATFSVTGDITKGAQWLVDGIVGGSKELGTIDRHGRYTAPSVEGGMGVTVELRTPGGTSRPRFAAVVIGDGREGSYEYLGYHTLGEEMGVRFHEAHAVALDPVGNLVVANRGLSVIGRFDRSGRCLGLPAGDPSRGTLDGPRDVEIDKDGTMFVVDGNNHRIAVFDPDGRLIRTFGDSGTKYPLQRPHSIAVDDEGYAYVADVDACRIKVYDPEGKMVRMWGKRGSSRGKFLAPHGVVLDPSGDVIVAEYEGRCQKFTPEGRLLTVFANNGRGNHRDHGARRYHTITGDRLGYIYLMSRLFGESHVVTVDKYDNEGEFVTSFAPGTGRGFPFGCQDAAVSPDGTVFVAETVQDRGGFSIFVPSRTKP